MSEEYDLSRFSSAHAYDYHRALREIRNGHKENHWMWYIFPQIQGLGYTLTSQRYAIRTLDEAAAFLADETLGAHLTEISGELLKLPVRDPHKSLFRISACADGAVSFFAR